MVALCVGACGNDDEQVVTKIIGAEGGLISSHDRRLTIVLQPGAVGADTEITIFPSEAPPDIYGAAYRVQPDIELRVAAEVSYRRPLPPLEPKAVAVAAVRQDDFLMGNGFWQPLPRLLIDVDNDLVTAKDNQLSLYYGMFDYSSALGGDGGGGACSTRASDCYMGNVAAAGAGPRDVCFGDFDGNGIGDVATADGRGDTVSILLGSPSGALAPPVAVSVGAGPSAIECGEISGDASSDFVVALEGASTVVFARSNGDGSFTLSDPVGVASGPVDLALIDVNGDGFFDAPTVGAAGAVTALTLMQSGGFVSAGEQPTAPFVASPGGLAVGNFSGGVDTVPDVAVFGGAGLVVGLGVGDGSFGEFSQMSAGTVGTALAKGTSADVTGDGLDDVIVADSAMGGVFILQSAGDGMSFTPIFQQTGAGASDVAIGDFDGDGQRADIAVANAEAGTVSVIVRVGESFTNAGALIAGDGPSGLAAADANGDGMDDIAVANESDDTVTLFLSTGV